MDEDVTRAETEHARRLDMRLGQHRFRRRLRHPIELDPERQRQAEEQRTVIAGRESEKQEHQHEAGQGKHDGRDEFENPFRPPAPPGGTKAEHYAGYGCGQHGQQRHAERKTRPVCKPRQQAAPIVIGAQQVVAAERRQARAKILRGRIGRNDRRPDNGKAAEQKQQAGADRSRQADACFRSRMGSLPDSAHAFFLKRGSSQRVRLSTTAPMTTNISPMTSAVPCTIGMSRSTIACTRAWPMPG